MRKKWVAFLLALVLFATSVLGNFSYLHLSTDVFAKTYTVKLGGSNAFGSKTGSKATVSLTKLSSPFGIAILNRPSSKSLWRITVDGHRVFCTNGEKHLCTGDSVKWTSAKATTYSNKSIAKAITYYYYVKKANCSTKEQGMIQAYIWACGKGVNKKTAMTQAAAHFGGGGVDAMYNAIEKTNPVGYIVTCRVTSCKNGKSKSGHQVLLGWFAEDSWKDGEVQLPGTVSFTPSFDISVTKKNTKGDNVVSGSATFSVDINGKIKTTTLTTKIDQNGVGTARINLDTITKSVKTKTYRYAKNWETMSEEARKDAKNKGITYKSRAEANAAAKKELKELKDNALAKLKAKEYTITVKETAAPTGYKISGVSTWTKKGKASNSGKSGTFYFTATDEPLKGAIEIIKKDENGQTVSGTAVYGLYADGEIYSYDDGTEQLKYNPGELVQKISVEDGKGSADGLYLGDYIVKELVAPNGYGLDPTEYRCTITGTTSDPVVINSTDPKDDKESYISIKKTKSNPSGGNHLPEENAEFYLIKYTACASSINSLASQNEAERQNFVKHLNQSDILAVCVTGRNGNAESKLENLNADNSVPEFVILQTKGEKGYGLAAPVRSSDASVSMTEEATENGDSIYHYSYRVNNPIIPLYFYLKKNMQSTSGFVAEANAEFDVLDENLKVVHHLKTNSNGRTDAVLVSVGTYIIRQTAGDDKHEFMEDQIITFTEEDKNTYNTPAKAKVFTFNDVDSPPDLLLIKRSSETNELLDGATFVVRDISGNEVGTLVTGLDDDTGKGSITLPNYGQYIIKETYAPKGFQLDSKEYTINVTTSSVKYVDGRYVYEYTVKDPPIYGEISLSKQGNGVDSYSTDQQGFVFKGIDMIPGATYALYAREDIKNSTGSVMWSAGTRITSLTTTKSAVLFQNPKSSLYAGMRTTDFWLGSYYIKEESVPNGYVLDTEEHDVILTDQKLVDATVTPSGTPDVEGPIGNNGIQETSGPYVLEIGEALNNRIKSATSVKFVQTAAPAGVTKTDVSHDKDGTVVMWREDTTYYISSQNNNKLIYLNAQSSHMFDGCNKLKEVDFNGVISSYTKDCSYMFADCWILEELDLSPLDTRMVQDTSYMFKTCRSLRAIYVFDTNLIESDEGYPANPLYISAVPNTTFELVDTSEGETPIEFKTEDFTFILHYDDGTEEEIEPLDSEVTFNKVNPNAYGSSGKKELQITFIAGKHAGNSYANDINKTSGGVHTNIYILDPNSPVEDNFVQRAHVDVKLTDLLQNVTINVTKKDSVTGKPLGGAVIGLFAAKDIYSADGTKIVSQNGEIARFETTAEENFSGIEFDNLPVNTGTGNMYYVQELVPPVGYKLDSTKHYVSARITDNTIEIQQERIELTNTELDHVSLVKYWEPEYIESKEAVAVRVNILKDGNVVSTVTLSQDNNWREVFDGNGQSGLTITKQEAKSGIYEFEEIPSETNAYSEMSAGWDKPSNPSVYTISNKPNRINVSVKKIWDDNNDKDGARPEIIGVRLNASDGSVPFEGQLSKANNWTTRVYDLNKNLTYEWEEVYTIPEVDLTDQKNGYLPIITTDGTDTTLTYITNVRGVDTRRTIKKVWNDRNDEDGIRPDSVKVTLLANGDPAVDINGVEVPPAILSSANNWTHTVTHLPIDINDEPIEYTWKEEMVENKNDVSQGMPENGYSDDTILEYNDPNFPMTGDARTGYVCSSTLDPVDSTVTIMTNTHIPSKGQLTVYKKVRGDVLLNRNIFPVTFHFTLTGTTIYGDTVAPITQSVTFTKEIVEQLMGTGSQNSGDYITISTTFDNLTYGEYFIKESGMKAYFNIEDIVDVVSGEVNINQDEVRSFIMPDSKSAATFVNGPYLGSFDITKYSNDRQDKLDEVEYVIESPYGEKMKAITGRGIVGIYDENGNYTAVEPEENAPEQGTIRVDGLLPGTYTITEVKTLKGLSLLREPLKVTIPLTMTEQAVRRGNVDTSKARYDEEAKMYYFYDLSYSVTDTPILNLPTTGALEQYLPLIIGFGFIMIGFIVFLKKKKK